MRKISALSCFLIVVASLVISSCQKDPSETITETSCQLSKAYYYDENGNILDSLVYTYTNNSLTKASNADGYMTFEYINDKITTVMIHSRIMQMVHWPAENLIIRLMGRQCKASKPTLVIPVASW